MEGESFKKFLVKGKTEDSVSNSWNIFQPIGVRCFICSNYKNNKFTVSNRYNFLFLISIFLFALLDFTKN